MFIKRKPQSDDANINTNAQTTHAFLYDQMRQTIGSNGQQSLPPSLHSRWAYAVEDCQLRIGRQNNSQNRSLIRKRNTYDSFESDTEIGFVTKNNIVNGIVEEKNSITIICQEGGGNSNSNSNSNSDVSYEGQQQFESDELLFRNNSNNKSNNDESDDDDNDDEFESELTYEATEPFQSEKLQKYANNAVLNEQINEGIVQIKRNTSKKKGSDDTGSAPEGRIDSACRTGSAPEGRIDSACRTGSTTIHL